MKIRFFVTLCFVLFLCIHAVPVMAENEESGLSDPHNQMKGPYPDGIAVTKACLECHRKQANEVLTSAHWLWKGPSPFVLGHEGRTDLGKRKLINNF
jgi:hypothetical protein